MRLGMGRGGPIMKKPSPPAPAFFISKLALVGVFALFCALFQVYVATGARLFYPVLKINFAVLMLQLVVAFVRAASRRKILWLAVLLVFLVRVPFYLHADGAMLTSDNAHEALQSVEMRDTHVAPYFLLGAVKHMGTVKYLMIAFLMDAAGNHYWVFLLFQAFLFVIVLFALYDLLKDSLHPPALFFLLFLTQFAFIETAFDFSLSLRGAPYLEMLFFVILGAGLIDREFRSGGRTFLGYYFLFYSIYIHPLGAVLVGSFGLTFLILSILRRRFWFNARLAAAGLAAGLYHWIYYLLFLPQPVAGGSWEQIGLLPLSRISLHYLGTYGRTLKDTFLGIFEFEFSYLAPFFNPGRAAVVGGWIELAGTLFTLGITVAGIFLAARKIGRLIGKRDPLRNGDWPWFLELILAAAFAAKAFLFYPPHTEPRHNFDLVFLIILSYLLVLSALMRRPGRRRWLAPAAVGLTLLMTAPHYVTFYEAVRDKDASYQKILYHLERGHIRYLTTDFIVSYPIYFLSGRKIHVSDSLGPFTVRDFYPGMRAEVDAVPPDQKAYMFFSQRAPNRPWHKQATSIIFRRTMNELAHEGITFRTHLLRDYIIVIPRRRGTSPSAASSPTPNRAEPRPAGR
jgi:hypothetical protein